jgi:hypothetical protein
MSFSFKRWIASRFGLVTKQPIRRQASSRLTVETLEGRLTLSAVTATFDAGVLTLRGDDRGNNIAISRTGLGEVSLSPPPGRPGTNIVGGTSFAGVLKIDIDLAKGDDYCSFNDTASKPLMGFVGKGGAGYDTFTISGLKVDGTANFELGTGADRLDIAGFARNISIQGGTGDKTISVVLSVPKPTYVINSVTISTAERGANGADSITISGAGSQMTKVDTLVIETGTQSDRVRVNSLAFRRFVAVGGSGERNMLTLSQVESFGIGSFSVKEFQVRFGLFSG